MRRLRPLVSLALALAATSAFPHSELPHPEWCAAGRIVVVASFDLTPELLLGMRERCRPAPHDGDGEGGTRHCDQFDDDYEVARRAALATCAVHQAHPLGPGDIGSVVHLVELPGTYNHDDHHQLYDVHQGLSGYCVRCESPPRPIAPIRQP